MKIVSALNNKIVKSLVITAVILALEGIALVYLGGLISKEAAGAAEKNDLAWVYRSEQGNFSNLESDYRLVSPNLSVIENALPRDEDLFKAVEAAENLASQFGFSASLRLESQASLPGKIPGVRQVPFSATLSGNYNSLKSYLDGLNNLPIFISISSISMSGQAISSDSSINLKGIIYVR